MPLAMYLRARSTQRRGIFFPQLLEHRVCQFRIQHKNLKNGISRSWISVWEATVSTLDSWPFGGEFVEVRILIRQRELLRAEIMICATCDCRCDSNARAKCCLRVRPSVTISEAVTFCKIYLRALDADSFSWLIAVWRERERNKKHSRMNDAGIAKYVVLVVVARTWHA